MSAYDKWIKESSFDFKVWLNHNLKLWSHLWITFNTTHVDCSGSGLSGSNHKFYSFFRPILITSFLQSIWKSLIKNLDFQFTPSSCHLMIDGKLTETKSWNNKHGPVAVVAHHGLKANNCISVSCKYFYEIFSHVNIFLVMACQLPLRPLMHVPCLVAMLRKHVELKLLQKVI